MTWKVRDSSLILHHIVKKGFPLDSLSRDIESKEYYYDMVSERLDTVAVEIGFLRFFVKVMAMKIIGQIVNVTIDRPLGSYHPKHKDIFYPINYGYIDGIMAPDGEEQDAYVVGVDVPVKEFTGRVIAVVHRNDDVEEKWVVCPEKMIFTKEEIKRIVDFQEKYFDSYVIMTY